MGSNGSKKNGRRVSLEQRNQLVQQHVGLASHIAGTEYRRLGHLPRVYMVDFLSAAYMGLVDAARGYQPHNGSKFSAYAVPRIMGAIRDEVREMDILTRHDRKLVRRLEEAEERWRREKIEATDEMRAHVLGMSRGRYQQFRVYAATAERSLDALASALADSADPEKDLQRKRLQDRVRAILENQNDRTIFLLQLHFMVGLSYTEIAQELRSTHGETLTSSRISQIINRDGVPYLQRKLADLVSDRPAGSYQ